MVLSFIGAVVVIVLLGGFQEQVGKRVHIVRFSVSDGVTGLERGSRVLVGGRPVGVVKGLEFVINNAGETEAIDVTVGVEKRIALRQGAVALLISPLLGGSGTINFASTGTGAELGPDDIIIGRIAPPTMLAQAGYGDEQRQQVQTIIRNVEAASEKMNSFMDDARHVSADVRTKWPEWSARLDSITKNTDEMMSRGPGIAQSLEDRLERLKEVAALAKEYLEENRQNVREGIASFRNIGAEGEKFMARLNGELSDKAAEILDKGRETLRSAEEAVASAKGILDEHTPGVRRMMANFRLSSDQLLATMGEVRRSPWRLLYRPDKREMDFELLYDSARTYATAVSDLRSAAETLQVISTGPASAGTASRAAEAAAMIDAAFDRYKEAEAEFLRQIMLHREGR